MAEVEVILDLVKSIYYNTKWLNRVMVTIYNDNIKLIRGLSKEAQKAT